MKIQVFLADGFEEVEAIAVIDLLGRAGHAVTTVSITNEREVSSARNIPVITDALLAHAGTKEADCIYLPGGMGGVNNLKASEAVLDIVRYFDANDKYIAAICAAPMILEKAGILAGKKITSYPGLGSQLNPAEYLEQTVVVDGKLITSRGPGTAIDLGLKLVEVFSGAGASEKLRKDIIYKV